MSGDCFICKKHEGLIQSSGEKIYEDDFVYVGHIDSGGKPNYLGHIMIDLKRHVPTLADMESEEAQAFGLIMSRVSKGLKECEGAEHIYALVSGNAVPHLHMHIVPRYPGTPEEYWGPFSVYDSPNARMGDNNEVIEVCRRIRSFLGAGGKSEG